MRMLIGSGAGTYMTRTAIELLVGLKDAKAHLKTVHGELRVTNERLASAHHLIEKALFNNVPWYPFCF